MNKKITILLLILIVILIAVGIVFFYYQVSQMPKQLPAVSNANLQLLNVNSAATVTPELPLTEPIAPVISTPTININSNQPDFQPASISINNFAFNPKQLTLKIGTTVTWINDDPAPHTIASANFNSQTLNTGDSYSYTFTQAGIYDYHCALHTTMTGQIIVQ